MLPPHGTSYAHWLAAPSRRKPFTTLPDVDPFDLLDNFATSLPHVQTVDQFRMWLNALGAALNCPHVRFQQETDLRSFSDIFEASIGSESRLLRAHVAVNHEVLRGNRPIEPLVCRNVGHQLLRGLYAEVAP